MCDIWSRAIAHLCIYTVELQPTHSDCFNHVLHACWCYRLWRTWFYYDQEHHQLTQQFMKPSSDASSMTFHRRHSRDIHGMKQHVSVCFTLELFKELISICSLLQQLLHQSSLSPRASPPVPTSPAPHQSSENHQALLQHLQRSDCLVWLVNIHLIVIIVLWFDKSFNLLHRYYSWFLSR